MSPLFLRRSATVYSMSQLEGGNGVAAGAESITAAAAAVALKELAAEATTRAAATAAVPPPAPESAVLEVEGAALPLYSFPAQDGFAGKRIRSFGDLSDGPAPAVPDVDDSGTRTYLSASDEDAVSQDSDSAWALVPQRSMLDMLLLAEWEDRAERGLFRYDVTACATRMVPGSYGFVAQLNEGRASKKRPTEFRVDQVSQPWDPAKFNFTKALQKEVLFQFSPGAASAAASGPWFSPSAPVPSSSNLVFINVSPIEYGHVLLVPRALDRLVQLVSPGPMLLALQFAREAANPYFRLGFNSLSAYGTVNHLHFQAYYMAAPFAAERAVSRPMARAGSVAVHTLADYPVRALVFEAGASLRDLAQVVGTACERLTAANVPHNLFIADSGARVFLYPNAFSERKAKGEVPQDVLDTQVDPAVFEISGHQVMKRKADYEGLTQDGVWRILSFASFTEQRFADVVSVARGNDW